MGNINITDKAISKIQEVLKEQNMKYFRIRVKGGGCSGFQYVFKSEDSINENKDIIFRKPCFLLGLKFLMAISLSV